MSAISPTWGVGADAFTDEDMELARRVVAAGSKVLDDYHQSVLDKCGYRNQDPRQWWVGKIDWAILFMEDETRCVLGQIFNSYSEGVAALVSSPPIDKGPRVHTECERGVTLAELNVYWAIANGFYSVDDAELDEAIPYGALEIAWVEVRDSAVG